MGEDRGEGRKGRAKEGGRERKGEGEKEGCEGRRGGREKEIRRERKKDGVRLKRRDREKVKTKWGGDRTLGGRDGDKEEE